MVFKYMADPKEQEKISIEQIVNHPAGPIAGLWPELWDAALDGNLEEEAHRLMPEPEKLPGDSE